VDLPKRLKAEVKAIFVLSPKAVQLDFVYADGLEINFKPGQFYSMKVADFKFRSYSIYSDSADKKGFSLVIEVAHNGVGANYIKTLKVGDTVDFVGPAGRFALRPPLPNNLYFFATGTGLAPFISMFYNLREEGYAGNVWLYFGIRHENEMILKEYLDDFAKTMPNFNYEVCVSQPESADFSGTKGRITQKVDEVKTEDSQYYICGNPFMLNETSELLAKRGIPDDKVIKEGFTYA